MSAVKEFIAAYHLSCHSLQEQLEAGIWWQCKQLNTAPSIKGGCGLMCHAVKAGLSWRIWYSDLTLSIRTFSCCECLVIRYVQRWVLLMAKFQAWNFQNSDEWQQKTSCYEASVAVAGARPQVGNREEMVLFCTRFLILPVEWVRRTDNEGRLMWTCVVTESWGSSVLAIRQTAADHIPVSVAPLLLLK